MFLEIDKKNSQAMALKDSEGCLATYGEIMTFAKSFKRVVTKRTLVFVLSSNCVGAAVGYLGAMICKVVPLMLSVSLDADMLGRLMNIYKPEYIWKPDAMVTECEEPLLRAYGYSLISTGMTTYPLYEDLSLLLTTSGSTGSPKLVRHSYMNLEAQARNISAFFELDDAERPMLDLPINYTYGLSILNSHLYSGATILLTAQSILSPNYWSFLKEERATSFTNVPYAYEILKKLRVFKMDLPHLKLFSQGGGKLSEDLHLEFAQLARETGRRFIVTYGQTEGSARMAYLPAEYAMEKCGSIGKAIPNGCLYIVDEAGQRITDPNVIGEMVYEGPNVTLGYAEQGEDLSLGDERNGVLYTGDMAKMDADGFVYIVGRKKRFLKLLGYRVSLDECENLIKSAFDTQCACVGNDEVMIIYVTVGDKHEEIKQFIAKKTNINLRAFEVRFINEIPRNEAGKIMYSILEKMVEK